MSKKPFHARVGNFTDMARWPTTAPHNFHVQARITDGPDVHIGRIIQINIDGTRTARQLAESLLAWADAKEKWYRDGDETK